MVATTPPRPPWTRCRTDLEEPREPAVADDHAAAWAFIWVLFAFKMATVFLIWWSSRSYETGVFLVATTWFWVAIPIIACAAPITFRWRLMKARKRRAHLQRSEWFVDDASHAVDPVPRPPRPR